MPKDRTTRGKQQLPQKSMKTANDFLQRIASSCRTILAALRKRMATGQASVTVAQAPPSRWQLLTALGLVTLTIALVVGAVIFRNAQLRTAQYAGRASELTWQDTLKDEDRSLLVAVPAPSQLEAVHSATFEKIYRGNRNKKLIALTFDDGPHPGKTPQLLAVLRQYNVHATFFVVGKRAEEDPELVQQEVADGHCIGDHTYHHDRLTQIPNADMAPEITACADVIKKITGKYPRYFRPPGGTFDREVTNTAQQLGYKVVLWSINPGDFERPTTQVLEDHILREANNGAIILFHDGVQQTIDALPTIITKLRARGFQFVTIDEMVAASGG